MADAIAKSDFLGGEEKAAPKSLVLWRPTAKTGLISWLTTVDHKRIGFLYGISALFFSSSAAWRRSSSACSSRSRTTTS